MRQAVFAALALGLALGAGAAQAGVQITVTPTVSPSLFDSLAVSSDWTANALEALYTGQSSAGTPGTPAYYQAQSNVTASEAVIANFPVWDGKANPGAVFGPAFANLLGNELMFGVTVIGTNGTQFSISQLGFTASSDDPGDVLGFAHVPGPILGYNYNAAYEGVLYGADGKLGGGDDTFITSGPATQLVDAIIGRGSGNDFGFGTFLDCPGCTTAQQQQAIDDLTNKPGLTELTGTYYLDNTRLASGSATFTFGPDATTGAVPEPTTWAMLILGLGGVGVAMRRRRTPTELSAA